MKNIEDTLNSLIQANKEMIDRVNNIESSFNQKMDELTHKIDSIESKLSNKPDTWEAERNLRTAIEDVKSRIRHGQPLI